MDEIIEKIEQQIKDAHDGKLIAYNSSEVMAFVGGLEFAIKMMEEIRPELREFISAMEEKLKEKDGAYGDSWKTLPHPFLVNKLIEEWSEASDTSFTDGTELVDVANVLFMLWHTDLVKHGGVN
ncbi:MAG: hypothetical protein ACTSPB_00225 [Candidatus Thorarchaeota archaeon]